LDSVPQPIAERGHGLGVGVVKGGDPKKGKRREDGKGREDGRLT